MHALPRQAASRAVATSSRPAASSFFICPSCSAAKTVTTPASARRHLGTTPARRHTAASTTSAYSTTSASTSTSAPPPPPPAGYARLTSRRLISIAGVDAAKFLQGIVTASTLDRHQGFYTGFLNATGRVLHDVWIYPDALRVGAAASSAGGEAFLIEVDAEQADTLLKHLKRYRLRSKFKLAPVEEGECGVWQVWNDNHDSAQGGGGGGEGGAFAEYITSTTSPTRIILPDTRAPDLGHRVLSTAPASQVASEFESLLGLSSSSSTSNDDDEAYRIRRYLLGVPEGQREIPRESSLPLEANMDLMGGIDFRKGCYVGQELTIRTKHRGVVRKRILPCVLYHSGEVGPERLEYDPGALSAASAVAASPEGGEVTTAEDIPQGSPIAKDAARKGRGAGTWLRGVGNIGLALCRLQVMTDVELPGEAAAGGGGLAPFDPSAEFVVKIDTGAAEGSAGDGTATGGDGGEQQQQQKQVKIKAFVPPWLRQRLDEANASKH